MYDFMSLNPSGEATDELIVELVRDMKTKYGKSTLTLEIASAETYLQIANFRFDNERVEDLISAIERFEFPESNTKQLLVSGPSFKFAINETYFNTKLRQLFESMYTAAESYDIVEEQDTYIRALALCAKSKKAFQYFYDVTQGIMIKHNFPEITQTYLDRFIFDVRLQQQSIDDFCQMYEQNLYFHVKMVADYQYGRCNSSNDAAGDVIKCVLMHLKRIDFRRFIILTTHFEVFRYLLDDL